MTTPKTVLVPLTEEDIQTIIDISTDFETYQPINDLHQKMKGIQEANAFFKFEPLAHAHTLENPGHIVTVEYGPDDTLSETCTFEGCEWWNEQ